VVLRNYEGLISTYAQPGDYRAHDPADCQYCKSSQGFYGQAGVAGLLAGETVTIRPEGWQALHQRSLPERATEPSAPPERGKNGRKPHSPAGTKEAYTLLPRRKS
jgi:lysine 2,3-aminomutase